MNYKSDVRNLLLQLEINRSYTGFEYIIYGVELVINDRNCLNYITKSLYLDIAKEYNTSWTQVERNIRTVVNAIWKNGNKELLKMICGGKIIKKPKNKEFFLLISDYIISMRNLQIAVTRDYAIEINSLIKEGITIGKHLKEKGYSKKDVELIISVIINYLE